MSGGYDTIVVDSIEVNEANEVEDEKRQKMGLPKVRALSGAITGNFILLVLLWPLRGFEFVVQQICTPISEEPIG
jgi:hypothetical protein